MIAAPPPSRAEELQWTPRPPQSAPRAAARRCRTPWPCSCAPTAAATADHVGGEDVERVLVAAQMGGVVEPEEHPVVAWSSTDEDAGVPGHEPHVALGPAPRRRWALLLPDREIQNELLVRRVGKLYEANRSHIALIGKDTDQ
jgi:hypothetical protein